ncbi:MAG TPA: hypothetical protein VEA38_22100, partial [Terriglobales bacterium]|nr:hypothetical protein [Terriglobales bacterium]
DGCYKPDWLAAKAWRTKAIQGPGGFRLYVENAEKRFGVSREEAAARLAASRRRGGKRRHQVAK